MRGAGAEQQRGDEGGGVEPSCASPVRPPLAGCGFVMVGTVGRSAFAAGTHTASAGSAGASPSRCGFMQNWGCRFHARLSPPRQGAEVSGVTFFARHTSAFIKSILASPQYLTRNFKKISLACIATPGEVVELPDPAGLTAPKYSCGVSRPFAGQDCCRVGYRGVRARRIVSAR